jgi:hypothetical protein
LLVDPAFYPALFADLFRTKAFICLCLSPAMEPAMNLALQSLCNIAQVGSPKQQRHNQRK